MKKNQENIFEDTAIQMLDHGSLIDRLRFWWCHYYKRPFLDPLLLQYTTEQLLVEYFATTFLDNPSKKTERDKVQKSKNKGTYIDEEEWYRREMGDNYISDDDIRDIDINL